MSRMLNIAGCRALERHKRRTFALLWGDCKFESQQCWECKRAKLAVFSGWEIRKMLWISALHFGILTGIDHQKAK